MISIYKIGKRARVEDGKRYVQLELRGLSTDTKPVVGSQLPYPITKLGNQVENGSVFVEIDTGKIYFYNLSNQEWNES